MCAYKRSHDLFANEYPRETMENYQEEEDDERDNATRSKKRCYWKNYDHDEVELQLNTYDSHQPSSQVEESIDHESDDMEEEMLPNIHEIKLNGLPLEGIYPRKPKYGRKIDVLIDDIIRKSQRQSESQNNYALIPTPDTSIWIPPAIGPHPTTDHHYISRHPVPSDSGVHHSENRTHSDFFLPDENGATENSTMSNPYLSLRNQVNRNRDDSSSDECDDMVLNP